LPTIAAVGYGDIATVSSGARLLAMFEIAIGMFYAIFAFSVSATFARDRK
jgi:hypothetical protein